MNDLTQFEPENPFIDWEKEILNRDYNKTCDGKDSVPENQRLQPAVAAALKELLLGLVKFTVKIGGQVVKIGAKLIELMHKTLELYPRAACGILIVVLLNEITKHAMFGFRHVQQASVMPLYPVIIGAGFLIDVIGSEGFKKFTAKIAELGAAFVKYSAAI